MTLRTHKEVTSDYIETSKIASDSTRTLAYSAIAVVWILRDPASIGKTAFPTVLLIAGILIMTALALDLIQHLFSSNVARFYLNKARNASSTPLPDDATVAVPDWYEYPSMYLYWAKSALMIAGCGFVLVALGKTFALI